MSKNGISTNQTLSEASVRMIKADGREFVFRYYCDERTHIPEKILRPAEAKLYGAQNLKVGAVYEFGGGAPRNKRDKPHPEDFAPEQAKRDAAIALSQARAVGQPYGSAIYFAVDNDFTGKEELGLILGYFQTIEGAFRESYGGELPYYLGVYGSGLVCRLAREKLPAAVRYSWLAESSGWAESKTYKDWSVKQSRADGSLGQLNYEDCESAGDFGGFVPEVISVLGPLELHAAQPIPVTPPGSGWTGILALAITAQTLARAQTGLGRKTIYQLGTGGNAGDIPQPLSARCDCSGFICWAIGVPRECPPRSDHWLFTDNIWQGGGDVGTGLFERVVAGSAEPGDVYVYPAPSAHHHGHIALIVAVEGGEPSEILHCSLSNYENTNDAVRITGAHVFAQNPQSRIMRPDYDAIRGAAGLAPPAGLGIGWAGVLPITPEPKAATTVFSIDTDLKNTRSPLDAMRIREFFEHQTEGRDSLKDIGEPVMAASAKYGINATYIVAHAILESGWGRSLIARTKNNLYGWRAYDADPSQAKAFASRAECIDYVMGRVNELYLTRGALYYRVSPCLGNKHYGMNANYAAEESWGSDIASIARRIEREV